MVRFGLTADPAQNEVNRGNELNFHRVRIQRVFAGSQRRAPDTAMAGLNLLAVTERITGGIISGGAMIRHNYADITDWNQSFGFDFHRAEPAVDKERTVGQHL